MARLRVSPRFPPSTIAPCILGGLLILSAWMVPPACAQVSVDMRALDSLGPAGPPAHVAPVPARPRPARPIPARSSPSAARAVTPAGSPARKGGAGGTPLASSATTERNAASPVAPTPPPVAIANIPALPTEEPAVPPAVTLVPPPKASTQPLPPPVRLMFNAGQTELTPADEAAIRDLAHEIPRPDASSVNVMAYAAGKPDDASTARRLSLSRGMAVRSVLLASGVPSEQIYVRALGSTATEGPADRVELIVTRLGTVTR